MNSKQDHNRGGNEDRERGEAQGGLHAGRSELDYLFGPVRYRDIRANLEAEADEFLAHCQHPKPIRQYWEFTRRAFEVAIEFAKQSRIEKPAALMGPKVFTLRALQIDVAIGRAGARPREWPKAPGTVFSWQAGESAADVALRFAVLIRNALWGMRGRCFSHGVMWIDGETCSDWDIARADDERIVRWRDETVRELRDVTLPSQSDWPMWKVHRDCQQLLLKMDHECEEAISVVQERSLAHATRDKGSLRLEYCAKTRQVARGDKHPVSLSETEFGVFQILVSAPDYRRSNGELRRIWNPSLKRHLDPTDSAQRQLIKVLNAKLRLLGVKAKSVSMPDGTRGRRLVALED